MLTISVCVIIIFLIYVMTHGSLIVTEGNTGKEGGRKGRREGREEEVDKW